MVNLLKLGTDWLAEQLNTHASTPVTYWRGADHIPLTATIGKTEFAIDSGTGIIERFQSRDYLILADQLVLSGTTILPKRGDRIREKQGAKTLVYEVMAPGKEPHWRYSDPFRKMLRVHTKQIATEGD